MLDPLGGALRPVQLYTPGDKNYRRVCKRFYRVGVSIARVIKKNWTLYLNWNMFFDEIQ